MITKPPFLLARELVTLSFTVDQPEVLVDAIVDLFLTNNLFSEFLQAMIRQEVQELGECPLSNLFGNNSVVAQIMGSLMQRTCKTYREQLLRHQITSILSNDNDGLLLEVRSLSIPFRDSSSHFLFYFPRQMSEHTDRNTLTLGNAFSQQIEDLTNCITTSVAEFPAYVLFSMRLCGAVIFVRNRSSHRLFVELLSGICISWPPLWNH